MLTIPAFAKVNYTLDILGRRPDGYHNLASLMQTISLADEITLIRSSRSGIILKCSDPVIPSGPKNLAWRAAQSALNAANRSDGVTIRLLKRTPIQAGLGGGSSDAAATLRGMNHLFELGLSQEKLLELAAELGSDVPFFLVGGTASVRGRGEQITALPDGPELWFVVVKPAQSVSTAKAYQAMDDNKNRKSARATREMEMRLSEGDIGRIISRMANDFEDVIFAGSLPISLVQDDLLMARARIARLCGSGSAVFGVLTGEADAKETLRLIQLKYPDAFLCHTVNRADALAFSKEEADESKY